MRGVENLIIKIVSQGLGIPLFFFGMCHCALIFKEKNYTEGLQGLLGHTDLI